ncbi:MAG TPA: sulfotransferase [Solirubrobacterales bacterium]|nr:sulfotransferase [Solirubrobacterales bacterium]
MNSGRPVLAPLRRVVFICGCGHSGTSLLANMFAAHPETYVPQRETRTFFDSPLHSTVRYSELKLRAHMAGKRYLVEKTPKHVRRLRRARHLAPRARFIISVRDGRDVVASIMRRGYSLDEALERWVEDNTIALAERDRDDVIVYRHEDLVENPIGVVKKICEGVGIPFNLAMLDYHKETRLWFGTDHVRASSPVGLGHEDHRNWQINQPIFDSSGRWRSELSSADLDRFEVSPVKELMEAFGYQ